MADYSKEGEELKDRFLQQYNQWSDEFYDGNKIRRTPSNPEGKGITKGRAERGINSFISSPDNVHLNYVDNRLSKGATTKSIMGGLGGRVQNVSQGRLSPYGVTVWDEIHHGFPLGTYGPALRNQSGSIRLDFFNRVADAGYGGHFGDGLLNVSGNSYDPRSHTGSRGGATKGSPIKAGYGLDGEGALSTHRRGTNDPLNLAPKPYGSGSEMFNAAEPIIKENLLDIEVGNAADAPRRRYFNEVLTRNGITPENYDAFAKGADPETNAAAKQFLESRPDLAIEGARIYDPREARKLIRKLSIASGIALGTLGTAADAAETGARGQLAAETKNPVDALQALISAATTTMGATGVGEVLGIPLEVVNMIIDTARDPLSLAEGAMNRRQLERAEKIRGMPAEAPQRSNALSVGFAEGGF